MTVALRPLSEVEYAAWRAHSQEGYADDMERNGGFGPEQALAKAQLDFDQILPDGLATPGQHVWTIANPAGETVGHAWLGERDSPGRGRAAFVYDVYIDEDHRGRGYGRAAMLCLEAEARTLGHDRIELNVFGGNEVARGLYRSLGYEERAVYMGKRLT
jgi:ribosomal protein S18 acetylase RimI-like enzyme